MPYETYTRFVDGQFENAVRRRSALIDGMTSYTLDKDEYIDTVYAFELWMFPFEIRDRYSLLVRRKTQTLANQAAMAWVLESGLFDLEASHPYGYKDAYRWQRPPAFDDLLRNKGRSGWDHGIQADDQACLLTKGDLLISIESLKHDVDQVARRR